MIPIKFRGIDLVQVSENTVMDYYLKLLKKDQIKFLVGKEDAKKSITKIIRELKKSEDIHDKINAAKELWKILFESAMVFIDPDKQGYDLLFSYFNEFVEFEELIFASDSFYRDHTLHSLWVYFLGEFLIREPQFSVLFSNMNREIVDTARVRNFYLKLNKPEIFSNFYLILDNVQTILDLDDSIRCIIALAHDLGYPLKKIAKINKSIGEILPYFSITNFGEFNFQYENVQQLYIEHLLELLSYELHFAIEIDKISFDESKQIDAITSRIGRISAMLNSAVGADENEIQELKNILDKAGEKELFILRRIFIGRAQLTKQMSRLLRFANDFEDYQHGIMSSYLLMKILNAFTKIQLTYSDASDLPVESLDFSGIYSKLHLLVAMADHTSKGYQIREINSYSAFLVLVDEIEEFSRISRADQYRQFVNQFCKTEMSMNDGCLCIDFIFDDENIAGLNPEIAFKDKCRRFLNVFDIPNLVDDLRIRFRCIGKLEHNSNIYEIDIAKNYVRLTINDKEKDVSEYLKTKEFFGKCN